MQVLPVPKDYERIKFVNSAEEVINTPFEGKQNVILFQRSLKGDFNSLAKKIAKCTDLYPSSYYLWDQVSYCNSHVTVPFFDPDKMVKHLGLTREEEEALKNIVNDVILLRESAITLEGPELKKDTFQWHDDEDHTCNSRICCVYNVLSTEGIYNEDVEQSLTYYDSKKDEYQVGWTPKPNPRVFRFNVGDIWKHKITLVGAGEENRKESFKHRRPDLTAHNEDTRIWINKFTYS